MPTLLVLHTTTQVLPPLLPQVQPSLLLLVRHARQCRTWHRWECRDSNNHATQPTAYSGHHSQSMHQRQIAPLISRSAEPRHISSPAGLGVPNSAILLLTWQPQCSISTDTVLFDQERVLKFLSVHPHTLVTSSKHLEWPPRRWMISVLPTRRQLIA